jgi:signal transduction histidine kinase
MVMRWAAPAAVVLTASIGLSAARVGDVGSLVTVVVGAGAALLFSVYLTRSADESRERRVLLEELERTRAELAAAERDAERRRMQRDLHDTVTQQLVGIVMHLDAAAEARDQPEVARALRMARAGLGEARRLVWSDRPRVLETSSLTAALRAASERSPGDVELDVDLALDGPLDALPAPIQTLVIRTVDECLSNVRKHAQAKRVDVTVSADEGLLTIDVMDDGRGFSSSKAIPGGPRPDGSGFGLRGLRERIEELGGDLVVESEPGAGTTVAVHVPLAEACA